MPTDLSSPVPPPTVDPVVPRVTTDRSRRRPRFEVWLTVAVVACVAAGTVASYIHASPKLSPIDEFQHVDYLFAVNEGHVPRTGERVTQRTMREEACRGLDFPMALPACDASATYDPNAFQERGQQTATSHPPVYYWLANVVGSTLDRVSSEVHGLVTGARLAGALWLALALALMISTAAQLGIRARAAAPPLLLVAASPGVLQPAAAVNPDSMSVLCGAAVLAAVVWWERRGGRLPLILLLAAVLLTTLIKGMNVIVVGGALIYLLVRWATNPDRSARSLARPVGVALAAVLVGSAGVLGWLRVVAHRTVDDTPSDMAQRFHSDSLVPGDIIGQVTALLSPTSPPYVPQFIATSTTFTFITLTSTILAAACFGHIMWRTGRDRIGATAYAAGGSLLVSGLVMALANQFLFHLFIPLPSRYGLVLLPFLLIPLMAACDQRRAVRWFTLALALSSLVVFLSQAWALAGPTRA